MNIQIIHKQPLIFRAHTQNYEFVKPHILMPVGEFRMIRAKVKGSSMGWNIEGEFLSILQLKEAYKKSRLNNGLDDLKKSNKKNE